MSIEDRLIKIEATLEHLDEFVTNHLSSLPEKVGKIEGRLDVFIPLGMCILAALLTLIVRTWI